MIPVNWIEKALLVFSLFGIGIGTLSLLAADRSIQLYQRIMKLCNWRVEPLDYKRELRNTKVLGALLTLLSALMVIALLRPEWFATGQLPFGGLVW